MKVCDHLQTHRHHLSHSFAVKMKLFAWLHRTIHPNGDYSKVSHDEKDKVGVACEGDAEQALLAEVLDGILAIGTLGQEYAIVPYEATQVVGNVEKDQTITTPKISNAGTMITPFEIEMQKVSEDQFGSSKEEISKPLLSDQPPNAGPMIESKIRKRTTLADLFSADVDVPEYGKADDGVHRLPPVAPDSSDSKPVTGEARRSFSKLKGSSIVKKLVMPYKGKGSPPKKKIDQLMTKMLKKKIHPSVEREINGPGVRSVNMMSTMDVEAEGSRIGCVSLF